MEKKQTIAKKEKKGVAIKATLLKISPKSSFGLLLIAIIFNILFCFVGKAETPDVFQALIETVAGETDETDEEEAEVPNELSDIVGDYYAEAIVDDRVATDVLSYLSSIYEYHGYYETGDWGGKSPRTPRGRYSRYVPYQGELPEYDYRDFMLPAEGDLTSGYGYRRRFRRFHYGIDISLGMGDTVRCVLPGVVTKIGYDPGGYGKYIIVSHAGGLETLYGHLNIDLAAPGTKLRAGEALGLGGTTGNATGPHLHFETRYLGSPVDPIPWFNMKSKEAKP
ncbi:MAG: M23 family metallopeptidase [Muribaculaceae bacterium]|nr:M23 family metallopeptidase [Muribaculaceae bacterium]